MRNDQSVKRVLSSAIDHGDRLYCAGRALETLANLLGADGSEHLLSDDDLSGLTHAVRAIGGYAQAASHELYEAAELAGALETAGGDS